MVILMVVVAGYSASGTSATKLTEVVSADDLTAEVSATVMEIEKGLELPKSFQATSAKLRRLAAQLAIFSQALAEHDEDSKFKVIAPRLRDASLPFSQAKSYESALKNLTELKQAIEGSGSTSVAVEYDWSKLASLRTLMDSLEERADQVRKALRRPRDPESESRHAAMMAVLALAVDAHADRSHHTDQKSAWRKTSRDVQRSMTKTALAMRSRDGTSALESFTAAHNACSSCHETFKP